MFEAARFEAALAAGRDPQTQTELCAPPPLHRRHAAWAVITIEAPGPEGLPAAVGRVRSRMRALLSSIERAGVADLRGWPGAFDMGPRLCRYAIGLGQRPPSAEELRKVVGPWTAGLHGVHVEHVEGGAVPTLR